VNYITIQNEIGKSYTSTALSQKIKHARQTRWKSQAPRACSCKGHD